MKDYKVTHLSERTKIVTVDEFDMMMNPEGLSIINMTTKEGCVLWKDYLEVIIKEWELIKNG